MKVDQLTFTRFIAAIAIVIYHFGRYVAPFNLPFLHEVFLNANLGVCYFFILSGFVMVIAYGKKEGKIDVPGYYLKRFARIYPVYFFALAITTILVIRNHGVYLNGFVLGAMLLQAWVPQYAVTLNSPGWSLSVEFLFYLLFPFLFNYLYSRFKLKTTAIGIIAFWALSLLVLNCLFFSSFNQGYASASDNFMSFSPVMHVNEFLVGNLIGLIYLRYQEYNGSYDIYLIGLFAAIILVSYFDVSLGIRLNIHDGFMALLFAPFILLLALNKNGSITRVLKHKSYILLGEISYSIYIIQYPVSLLTNYFYKMFHISQPEVVFYSYVPILLAASFACYYFIEIPVGNWIRAMVTNKKELSTNG